MAWETTYLLSSILLVLLASGCCAEDAKLFQEVEGQTFSVKCRYDHSQHVNMKVWCRQTPTGNCKVLVSNLSTDTQRPKFSIRDDPDSHFFTVTMTALTVRDSGLYFCGILENERTVTVLRRFRLVVSRAVAPPTTSWKTTVLASANSSATSPVTHSPPDNWMWKGIIAGVAVAVLLLLVFVVLVVLYLRNARGRAQKVENECHNIYEEFPGQKEENTDVNQQILSTEDTEDICYASLIYLNHVSPQDSISSISQPYQKPSPDPLMSVEYASISRNRLQTSKAAAQEVETRN